jgi:hypothetical protein
MVRTILKKQQTLIWIFLFVVSFGKIYAYAPTVVLGLFAEEIVFSETSAVVYLTNIQLNGLFGWRIRKDSGITFSLNSRAEINGFLYDDLGFSDAEILEMKVSFPAGSGQLDIISSLDASLLGVFTESAYLHPDWHIKYLFDRGSRKLNPYLAYKGYYLYSQSDTDDGLYQGGEVGFAYRPSIRRAYEVSLEGGWEGWPDYPMFDSDGSLTKENRKDLLTTVNGSMEGLLGYFLNWELSGSVGIRWSTANRYLSSLSFLEENSENNVFLSEEGELKWSPHRRLDLQIGIYSQQTLYLGRQALTEIGALSGETLKVLTSGLSLRIDWTLNDRFYLVGSGTGTWRVSNDPNEWRWYAAVSLGIEYSL